MQRSDVQRSGQIVNTQTQREIGRDSQGRIHNEMRTLVPLSDHAMPALLNIHLYDPATRINTFIDPHRKTFTRVVINRPPATEPPDAYASPSGNSMPLGQYAKEEDLGDSEIDGLQAHGVRITQTIPPESSETGAEVVTTDEYWYSNELRLNLVVKHHDPRTGSVEMTVSHVCRSEPDRALFEVPSEYKRVIPMR